MHMCQIKPLYISNDPTLVWGGGYNVEVGNFWNKLQHPSQLYFANTVMFTVSLSAL